MAIIFKSSLAKLRDCIIALCRSDSGGWSAWLYGLSARHSVTMRYILVGVLGAIIETALFAYLFRLGFGIAASNVVAFHVAFITCYFLHYYYTHSKPFEGNSALVNGLGKYTVLMYGHLIIGSVLLWLLIQKFGLNVDLAKIVQVGIVTPGSYVVQKTAIFRSSRRTEA